MMFHIGRGRAAAAGIAAFSVALSVSLSVLLSPQAFASEGADTAKPAVEIDAEAAEVLARRQHCFKCHAIDKKKDGPAYKSVAAKYKDKPDAEARLMKHLTSGEVVKLASGEEEEHRIIKSKDEKEVTNLIRWILSQ